MIVSQIISCEKNRDEFLKLLEFRYLSYVKELSYLAHKAEFDMLKMEFDQYDLYSEHIALRNEAEIVACARIIKDSEKGLPILNKTNGMNVSLFLNQKNVEISRLIVKKEYRSSTVFINLIQAVFKIVLNMDCTYVLADTFVNSSSYKLLKMLGFKMADVEYEDSSFNVNEKSTLLYFRVDEMIEMLKNNPNKSQLAFLKNIGYSINKK